MLTSLLSYHQGRQTHNNRDLREPASAVGRRVHHSHKNQNQSQNQVDPARPGAHPERLGPERPEVTPLIMNDDISAELDHFGISWSAIADSDGEVASRAFPKIISAINATTSALMRVSLTSGLLTWQTTAAEHNLDEVIGEHTKSILKTIEMVLHLPDDGISPKSGYSFGYQMPGLYLAQLLFTFFMDHPQRVDEFVLQGILDLFDSIFSGDTLTFAEPNITLYDGSPATATCGSVRSEIVHTLFGCFPQQTGRGKFSRLDGIVQTLFQFLDENYDDIIPVHRTALHESNHHLRTATSGIPQQTTRMPPGIKHDAVEILCLIGMSNPRLFYPSAADLVHFVHRGYAELAFIIRSNIEMFAGKLVVVEYYLDYLLSFLGFNEIAPYVVEMVEINPLALVRFVPILVRELCTTAMKSLLLSVLLAIALCPQDGHSQKPHEQSIFSAATVLRPYVRTIAETCESDERSFIPLFKLLSVLSCSPSSATTTAASIEETAVDVMRALVELAKSHRDNLSSQHKSALLGALDIAKTHVPKRDVFKSETLVILESYAKYNGAAYRRLMGWNSGDDDPDLAGSLASYLRTAGNIDVPDEGGFLNSLQNGTVVAAPNNNKQGSSSATTIAPSPWEPFCNVRVDDLTRSEGPSVPPSSSASSEPAMGSASLWVAPDTASIKAVNLFGSTGTLSNSEEVSIAVVASDPATNTAVSSNPFAIASSGGLWEPIDYSSSNNNGSKKGSTTWIDRAYTKDEEEFFESLKKQTNNNGNANNISNNNSSNSEIISSNDKNIKNLPGKSTKSQSSDAKTVVFKDSSEAETASKRETSQKSLGQPSHYQNRNSDDNGDGDGNEAVTVDSSALQEAYKSLSQSSSNDNVSRNWRSNRRAVRGSSPEQHLPSLRTGYRAADDIWHRDTGRDRDRDGSIETQDRRFHQDGSQRSSYRYHRGDSNHDDSNDYDYDHDHGYEGVSDHWQPQQNNRSHHSIHDTDIGANFDHDVGSDRSSRVLSMSADANYAGSNSQRSSGVVSFGRANGRKVTPYRASSDGGASNVAGNYRR